MCPPVAESHDAVAARDILVGAATPFVPALIAAVQPFSRPLHTTRWVLAFSGAFGQLPLSFMADTFLCVS